METDRPSGSLRGRLQVSAATLARLADATLAAVFLVVVSGAVVRLTDSGLGCDGWPDCSESLLPEREFHATIEFVNRIVALIGIISTLVMALFAHTVRRARPRLFWAAVLGAFGMIAQIPLGGLTVLLDLHPLAVMAHFLLALIVVAGFWLLGSWLARRQMLDRVARRNPFLRELTRTTVRWVISLIGVLIALEIMDATALVGAVLGTAGVMGVALGFAFKSTMENYLAGILMSLRQPFSPKDHVVIDGNEGIVVALTSRATILMTLDGNHLRLPNALVFSSVMLNYTRNPSRRFGFDVGIGVNEDLVRAQQIGIDVLSTLEGVLDTPPPRAYITALGDSNVQIRYQAWVDQRSHDFASVKSEGIRQVKLALEAAGMDMPEPIYRVQLSERGAASSPGVTPPATSTQTRAPAAVDTRVQADLEEQIAADQRSRGSEDLLDPGAPKE